MCVCVSLSVCRSVWEEQVVRQGLALHSHFSVKSVSFVSEEMTF